MNINLPKYNQTVYAELLQAMVWNNKCALCAATGTGKSYIAAKFVQEAVIEQDTLIWSHSGQVQRSGIRFFPKQQP